MRLTDLAIGDTATITAIRGRGAFRRRLLELGIVPGTPVSRTGQAPLGDPITYRVRGAVIALRRDEADTVVVEAALRAAAK